MIPHRDYVGARKESRRTKKPTPLIVTRRARPSREFSVLNPRTLKARSADPLEDAKRQRNVRVRAGTLSVDNGPARGRVCELPSPPKVEGYRHLMRDSCLPSAASAMG